jgi:hypothetical protein
MVMGRCRQGFYEMTVRFAHLDPVAKTPSASVARGAAYGCASDHYGKVTSDADAMPFYTPTAGLEIITGVSTLTEIQRLSRRLATADAKASDLRAERDAAIAAAHANGESPSLIAHAAHLSEQAVFKILRGARAKEE